MGNKVVDAFTAAAAKHEDRIADLARGANEKAIADFQKKLGHDLPASFYDLYRWHNGQSVLTDCPLVFAMEFQPLKTILITKKGLDNLEAKGTFTENWKKGEWWNPGWVPFMDDRCSTILVIDTAGCFGGKKGQILRYGNDSPDRSMIAPSFDDWLALATKALAKKCDPDAEAKFLLKAAKGKKFAARKA